MVKIPTRLEASEAVCPACGAGIKATSGSRPRRVQCPKCREVVFIEKARGHEPEAAPAPAPGPDSTAEARGRIELLESRVEALEATLRDALAATRSASTGAVQRKLVWLTSPPGQPPEFSPEQGEALLHNLGGVRSQGIAIRTPAGDPIAQAHAEWFKLIFERAGWTVHGPDEIPPRHAVAGLSLAVPELPVAKDAAATYLALKAAGFETNTVLETEAAPKREPGQGPAAISLTLPSGKAA